MRYPLALALLLALIMASAASAVEVSVPTNIVGVLGEIALAPVEIDDATGLFNFDLAITYDTNLLDLSNADVRTGSLTSGWVLVPNIDDAQGYGEIACFTTEPLGSGSGSLLELDFHVTSAPGMSPVCLSGTFKETIVPTFTPGCINTVPEPCTLALLLGGLLLVLPRRR